MAGVDDLSRELSSIAELLRKYGHGQATVVDEILASLDTAEPQFRRLSGIDVWGGSGAVWEVSLSPLNDSQQAKSDQREFCRSSIQLAKVMDQMNLGTNRSRFIASTFQKWLDKKIR